MADERMHLFHQQEICAQHLQSVLFIFLIKDLMFAQ